MIQKFNLIIEKDEDDWYISEVVELPGCHTQAKSMDKLIERTKEAVQAYLGNGEKHKIEEKFIGIQQIEV